MTYKAFLIKYAEIAIKGKNRYLFEDALVSQISHALKKVDGEFPVSARSRARIYVETVRAITIMMETVGGTAACVRYRRASARLCCWRTKALMTLAEEVIALYRRGIPGQAFYV